MKSKILQHMVLILLAPAFFSQAIHTEEKNIMEMTDNIHWLGQAAVKITALDQTIYIDPFQIEEKDPADIILITHSHGDHLSPGDIKKISHSNTTIIAPRECLAKVEDIPSGKTMASAPGFRSQAGEISIEAVPAYNIKKTNFHPRENQWVGYILTINGVRIYHAGDTERIPEMKNIRCDVALLPLGQTYTMNSVQEAAEAALDVKASVAIPIHYGTYEGTTQDADQFKTLLAGKIKVIIKERE